MINRKAFKRCIILFAMAALASPLSAQEMDIEAGAHINQIIHSEADGTQFEGGLQARLRTLSFISLEGRLNVRSKSNNYAYKRPWEVAVLIYPYRTGVVDLFGIIGAHYLGDTLPDALPQNEWKADYGLGADIPLQKNLSISIDYRWSREGLRYVGPDQFDVDWRWRSTIGFQVIF